MKVDSRTGLSERVTALPRAEVRRFPEVRATYLYGPRARGDYKPVCFDSRKNSLLRARKIAPSP